MPGITCNGQKCAAHKKILSHGIIVKKLGEDHSQSSFQLYESLIQHVLTHFPPTNLSFFQKQKVTLEKKKERNT